MAQRFQRLQKFPAVCAASTLAVLLAVALSPPAPLGAAQGVAAEEASSVPRTDEDAEALVALYVEETLHTFPSQATAAGRHDLDAELEDLSDESIASWVAFNRQVAEGLEGYLASIGGARHDRPASLDAELVLREARREVHAFAEREIHRTSPLFWTGRLSNATVMLLVRDDRPAPERVRAAVARAGELPRLAAQATAALAGTHPERIAPELAGIAQRQAASSAAFYRDGFAETVAGVLEAHGDGGGGEADAALVAAAETAGAGAAAALEHLAARLEVLASTATGSPRLGPEGYAEVFRLGTGIERPVPELLAEAEAALVAKRSEAAAYGRSVWAEVLPGEEPPADDLELLARLFDRVAQDRAETVEEFIGQYQELLDRSVAFVRARRIITLPDPLTVEINRSPSYFVGQSVGGVYPAGPYAPEADTLFYLPTPPDDATPEERDAFFRDFNDHFNVMILPHEMVPGHYLQLKRAALEAPVVRSLFGDGVYVEGWGTFCERLMLDLGWGGPLDRLAHLKKQLENIARTIVDIRVHTAGMTREEVLRFVREEALQDEQFAGNMWVRAITSSPQITTYFQGYDQVMGLYEDVREARGEELVLREFMDGMMELGPVPVYHYRARMLGGS